MMFIFCILTFLAASACILLVAFAGWLIKLMLEDIMVKKEIIIDDVNVGDCSAHKCDLKNIRELEEKLSNKKKECEELHKILNLQKEEIKNLNYTLYEERNLTTDLAKANLKISALKRDLSSVRNRFKYEQLKCKEQQCEEWQEKLIKISGKYEDTLSIVEDMAIFLDLDKKDHFNICQCFYALKELKEQLQAKEQECEELKAILQASDIAKTVISSAEINFPIIEKLSNALDEIEKICQIKEENSQFVLPSVWQQILDIIHETKEK